MKAGCLSQESPGIGQQLTTTGEELRRSEVCRFQLDKTPELGRDRARRHHDVYDVFKARTEKEVEGQLNCICKQILQDSKHFAQTGSHKAVCIDRVAAARNVQAGPAMIPC